MVPRLNLNIGKTHTHTQTQTHTSDAVSHGAVDRLHHRQACLCTFRSYPRLCTPRSVAGSCAVLLVTGTRKERARQLQAKRRHLSRLIFRTAYRVRPPPLGGPRCWGRMNGFGLGTEHPRISAASPMPFYRVDSTTKRGPGPR